MSAARACTLCDARCTDADLPPLLEPALRWLWQQVAAAADRRGDPDLVTGTLTIAAPVSAADRAAASGLLGGQPLRPGQRRRVDLEHLTNKVRIRGQHLTPGAVAAHGHQRPLAVKAKDKARRDATEQRLRAQLDAAQKQLPDHLRARLGEDVWPHLRQSGWVTRLVREPDPTGLLADACAVLAALPVPGQRLDRRVLVPSRPHALDDSTPLAGLVFALTRVAGRRPRRAWDELGVDIDNLTGGLLALGVHPAGWQLPLGAVVTLPPRELADVRWPAPPQDGAWVFVTENPSVLAAAADLVRDEGAAVRLLCTVGTPSALENAAVGRLLDAGWNVAVRADFDPSGLAHVRALLAAAPGATPWRMSVRAYELSTAEADSSSGLTIGPAASPWAPELAAAMTKRGCVAYEEDLLPALLKDLFTGHPPAQGS